MPSILWILWKLSFILSTFSDRIAHHGWEIGFVQMGREHAAYETDAAGFESIAAGSFDGSECLVIVQVTGFAAGCVIGVEAGTGLRRGCTNRICWRGLQIGLRWCSHFG